MIEVENLSKRYGNKLAVDGLSFVVQPGIVTGFLGPNGAGKSTTMRMIAGLDEPTGGRVVVNGGDYRTAAAPMAELGVLLEAKAVHTVAFGTQSSARPGADQRHQFAPGGRGDRHGRTARGGREAGRRLLAGNGSAVGRGVGLAGQSADRGAGRTRQRTGPGGGQVDANHAQELGRGRTHGIRLLPPDERDGPDRNPFGGDRSGTADRRHHCRRVRRRGLPAFASRSERPRPRTCGISCWPPSTPS